MMGVLAAGRWAMLFFVLAGGMAAPQGDAQKGARIVSERGCTDCHRVAGQGGTIAPDLGRRSSESFTPAALAASIWNHGPAMWKAMEEKNTAVPTLTPSEVLDLYAYFFALRYFEPAGDAARGKAVFTDKNCYRCHALVATESAGVAPPVARWESLGDPVQFIQQMWNHGTLMQEEIRQRNLSWPRFTVEEMADLLVYVRNLPGGGRPAPLLRFGDPAAGEDVFEGHQCLNCHTFGFTEEGTADLAQVSRRERSLTGLAVAMWNHRPLMSKAAEGQSMQMKTFEAEEMRQLVAYLFEENFFDEPGDADRGARVFEAKQCGSCHGQAQSRAPALRGGPGFTAPILASGIWRHGAQMAAEFERQNREWPTLTGRDVVDLVAFLNRK